MIKQSFLLLATAGAALLLIPTRYAQAQASQADKTFAGKVSQGGMYEVVASQVAERRASAPNVKDLATTEVHDHTLVNRELKAIAVQASLSVASMLNPEFRERLAKLEGVSKPQFDAAYIADMQQIHAKDEKLFAQEAVEGSSRFKSFAHQTDLIVKRHIGALHGLDQ